MRRALRRLDYRLQDLGRARLFGDLAPLVPRVEDMFDGPKSLREFKANGDEFLAIYRDRCGLRPDERMLDVGCGIGRKTIPLTRYFTPEAVYEGIEINSRGVAWCRERITPRFPNFRFQQIDVYNRLYHPEGGQSPAEYRFPFPDESFTFVFLGSVFTHMLPDDAANYLAEVRRVLRPGGRCLISYFLLDEESERLLDSGAGAVELPHRIAQYRTLDPAVPEHQIAFDESWVRGQYETLRLKIARIDYGSWCGRQDFLSYQDLVLAKRD